MNPETLAMVRKIIFSKTQPEIALACGFTAVLCRRLLSEGPTLPWVIVYATGLVSYERVRALYPQARPHGPGDVDWASRSDR